MPTTNTNFSTLITAIDTKAQSLAASTTDPKDLVFLGKTVEALNVADTVSAVISEGDTQVTRVTTEGTTQVAAVQAAGAGYAPLAGATFTGAVSGTDLTLSGNLTVSGTTTTINTATLDVADINITIADGAADSAAADGAGITIEGAGVNFQWSDANQEMSLNKKFAVNGTLDIEEVYEKVTLGQNTGSTEFTVDTTAQGVTFLTTAQTANRAINLYNVNANLATGQSVTCTVLVTQGSTAYYFNAYKVDGTVVTPKWQGGSAPTGGNASGIDAYTFTIIKTADATFTVLASQTAFA